MALAAAGALATRLSFSNPSTGDVAGKLGDVIPEAIWTSVTKPPEGRRRRARKHLYLSIEGLSRLTQFPRKISFVQSSHVLPYPYVRLYANSRLHIIGILGQ